MPSVDELVAFFFSALNERDYESIFKILSPSFVHDFLPASLNGLGQPARDKTEFLEFLRGAEKSLKTFGVSPRTVRALSPTSRPVVFAAL